MPHRQPARRVRIRKLRVAVLLVAVAAIVTALDDQLLASAPPTVSSPPAASESPTDAPRRSKPRGGLGEAGGAVPSDATVFDDGLPGVANLDQALLAAVRRAAEDAAQQGIEFVVNSGWRSADYQEQLLREAVSKFGSREEAARWVATPDRSAHVSGDAIDVGPSAATTWLSEHGASYGLCQVYGNEPWHFELRPEAVAGGCPPVYADPTQDPRMRG